MVDIFDNTYQYDKDYNRFADFLGIDKVDRDDFKLAKKLAFLRDWASDSSDSDNFVDAIKEITKAKRDLGINVQGKTLVDQLYQWARLDTDGKQIKEEQKVRKERLTEKQRKIEERKQRILDRKKKWEETKDELNEQHGKTQEKAREQVQKLQKQKEKQKPKDTLEVEEVPNRNPEPELVPLD